MTRSGNELAPRSSQPCQKGKNHGRMGVLEAVYDGYRIGKKEGSRMARCPKCGWEIVRCEKCGNVFCPGCALDELGVARGAQYRCPVCGSKNVRRV